MKIWWGGGESTGGIFPVGGDEQIFGWGQTFPIPPSRENPDSHEERFNSTWQFV